MFKGNRFTLALALFQRCIRTDDELIEYRRNVVQKEAMQMMRTMWLFLNIDPYFGDRLKNGASMRDVVSTLLDYCGCHERRMGSFWFGVFLLFTEAKVRAMWDQHLHPRKGLRSFALSAGFQTLMFAEA
ncbi:hypothetical protein [Nevskia ramosa]|uniref:hypothetical protein n=1 Tax=Nevskia ramosa TaxID=64002 RepID=UPI002357C3B7|nr:hypothetical protein [Nevskia ramosa]